MMNREECLKQAKKCVCTDKNETYGKPEDNFDFIAKLWGDYLGSDYLIDAKDVAVMMMLLKVARIATGKHNPDNYIDIAGYAACGCEIGDNKRQTKPKLRQVAPTCAGADSDGVTNQDFYADEIESNGGIEKLAMSKGVIGRCSDDIRCSDCDFNNANGGESCAKNIKKWLNAPHTDQKTEKKPVVTNLDFYAKEITKNFGYAFIAKVEGDITVCDKINCCDCDFFGAEDDCEERVIKWLDSPYISPEMEKSVEGTVSRLIKEGK